MTENGYTPTTVRRLAKSGARQLLPLAARQRLAVWLNRQSWVRDRHHLAMELVRDMAEEDPNGFHRFLWSNHLAYAQTYEVELRFDPQHVHPTRHMLLDDVRAALPGAGLAADRIGSVLDVGCSLGYVLHHIEHHVFPGASRLMGIDIDRYAVETGRSHLQERRSRVQLEAGDMAELDRLVGAETFDLVLCAGTLMYLKEADAAAVVAEILRRTRGVAALTGLAAPDIDNAQLAESAVRARDGSFIHNLDAMVAAAGGRVIARRWEGARQIDGNTIYFVLATPADSPQQRAPESPAAGFTRQPA